ncbi:MAG: bifunctional phosphopantothenoylcysteine decarboxylase/phosphopantothenate--cysteine ligase CoaBC [Desulfuromonadaceae bacterium]|nr:bifunctional phosphopantothenoylcysteine decarboxylase/phosphopantothenate--cysteine ligase CoaBC [Desulfuromonadaceae bacterium]MDD2854063.1 bifunctional phosphopantothenoylcysteine decarboxylase/phosphopantothenate--cysteine ligase CoaBC [Desulfuromonadaceae bacterium]
MLKDKKIILGVCGGIAAYKAVELLRLFTKAGADVNVVMTRAASEFVTPLTFQTLSSNPVHTELFNLIAEQEIGHISLADRADLVVIAPATANVIGKIASGIADDILTTTVMATKAPVLFAPAMNVNMYTNPIYQENEAKLRRFGYFFESPVTGALACGWEGSGKLASPEAIFESAASILTEKDLDGRTILITAGPTREELDPVRYITNHSSGKMGYAIAKAARRRGATVLLISGPTSLPAPAGLQLIKVSSAVEMLNEVMVRVADCDAVIKAAAVADYRPVVRESSKIKKSGDSSSIRLVKNPDILAELGRMKSSSNLQTILVGFAAETDSLAENAAIKLNLKNLDMIVANDVTQSDAGFNVDTNRAVIFFRDGSSKSCDLMSKDDLADVILDQIAMQIRETP